VLEEGAGQGVLAGHVQAFAQEQLPALAKALHYQTADVGRPAEIADAPLYVILSNELIDAFPVHLVEVSGGHMQEVYVTERDGRLVEQPGDPSSPEVAGYLARFGLLWRAGTWRAEINLRALEWMRATAARLARRGFVLTIDYGDTARRLYSRHHPRGTLLCYYRHTTNEEPLARPGQQDITAHVNFSALIDEGRRVGLSRSRFTTQRDFLEGWGIREEMEAYRARHFGAADTARHTDQGQADHLRAISLRNAVNTLLAPGGLGDFRVLVQRTTRAREP
jgi:SAM-dependent MidA family methyltransferase